jgi:two-component system chemotaxis sensor kinase CheA
LPLLDELRELGECSVVAVTDAVPDFDALVPTECHLAWDVTLVTRHGRDAIEDVFIFVIDDMTLDIQDLNAVAQAETTEVVETVVAAATPVEAAANEGRKAGGDTVRVPAERLDEMMDRVGELVIAQSRLKQLAASSSDIALRAVAEEIERLAAEMRDTMMVVRMVPIAQLFSRFRRLIHDLARDTGKTIELSTEGEATELDKTVIERLADPLIHLIRNAADHGLETPEQRLAAGKPEAGQVVLAARQSGAEVVITITDDGRGVDRARVRAKAEENGLIQPGQVLSDNELLQLIFAPGFSTAAAITNLSGRGVGMDVVKRTIEGLRGSIELTSTPGQGSVVSLRIPLTLAIIDGLLVRVGTGRYVIPLASVEECVELSVEQDVRSTGRSLITLRDQLVPFIRLRQMFATGQDADPHQKIVVVSTGQERVGLVVDQILGDHQTVIKALSAFHAEVGAFSGATILGDGGVALILDMAHLVAAGQRQDAQLRAAS